MEITARRAARILSLAVGGWEAVRLSGWRGSVRVVAESAASPAVLAALVRAVERETTLVPGVRRVRVTERSAPPAAGERKSAGDDIVPDGWVRYEVEGT